MAYPSNTNHVVLLITALVAVVGLIGYGPTVAQATCVQPNLGVLITYCSPYFNKQPTVNTGSACCRFLKGLDIACACSYVTKDMESFVSPAKAIDLARRCGAVVKSGTKCGSYTVPRA